MKGIGLSMGPVYFFVLFGVPKPTSLYHLIACQQTLVPDYTMDTPLIFRQILQIFHYLYTLSVAFEGPHTPGKAPGSLCLPWVHSCT